MNVAVFSFSGWVGFGLSTNGDMFPADVVIGWVSDDGTAHISVRAFNSSQRCALVLNTQYTRFKSANL